MSDAEHNAKEDLPILTGIAHDVELLKLFADVSRSMHPETVKQPVHIVVIENTTGSCVARVLDTSHSAAHVLCGALIVTPRS